MARKYVNESYLSVSTDNSGNKNQEHYGSKVKVPNYNQVIIKENINVDKNKKPIYAESSIGICNNFQHTKEEVTEDLKKNGYEVIRFEPVIIRVVDRCPNCELVGRPKFDRRPNAFDYHVRSSRTGILSKLKKNQDPERADRLETNRPDDYVLTYSHKIENKVKKCTIGKLDKNHLNIIKESKVNEKMKEHIFPFYIESMRNT
ncbi:hypothetical protein [Nitrosopumilus ureiphilus]|uniref:Uncharacterized protein n=1 Tax=Nitrosopumilus ureiphilus TaxID=1470067 RepID=A0A7D5RDU8_9ARCH|nr:hypothetical protein [Nitrosopumilus ureiphilus]QLH06583.1 hypothetical protein C5F50_05500 [Nitrosopumilus ureiphilus]